MPGYQDDTHGGVPSREPSGGSGVTRDDPVADGRDECHLKPTESKNGKKLNTSLDRCSATETNAKSERKKNKI